MSKKFFRAGGPDSRQMRRAWFVLVSLLSVGFMLFVFSKTISPFFDFVGKNEKKQWILRAHIEGAHPTAEEEKETLEIEKVFVDGRLLRWKYLEGRKGWEEERKDNWTYPSLKSTAGRRPELRLSGHIAQFFFPKCGNSGKVDLSRNGRLVKTVDLSREDKGWERTILEDPPLETDDIANIVFLCLALGSLFLLRPWSTPRRRLFWVLFFLVVVHLCIFVSYPVGTNDDGPGYVLSMKYFFTDGFPSYFPPGYPILMKAAGIIPFLGLGLEILLLQHVLTVLAFICLYMILLRVFSEEFAYLWIFVISSLASSLFLAQTIVSENVAVCFAAFAIFFALKAEKRRPLLYSVLSGAMIGFAGLSRLSPLGGLIPAAGLIFWFGGVRKPLKHFLVLLLSVCVVVVGPMLWCFFKSGNFGLADSTGLHLYQRMIFQQGLVAKDRPYTKLLLQGMDGKDIRKIPHWGISDHLHAKGAGYRDIERLLFKVSMESLKEFPVEYLLGSFENLWELVKYPRPYDLMWAGNHKEFKPLEQKAVLTVSKEGVRFLDWSILFYSGIWPYVLWGSIFSLVWVLLRLKSRYIEASIAITFLGYYLVQVMVEVVCGRYNMAVAPFIFVILGGGFKTIGRFLGALFPGKNFFYSYGADKQGNRWPWR